MYLAIDVGGTKTLVATLDNNGVITERIKFQTPDIYAEFLKELAKNVDNLATKSFTAAAAGIPGRINREKGIAIALGNLPWRDVPIQADIRRTTGLPTVIENDANLAGLSEAMLLKDRYDWVLFVTISTGIGVGVISKQTIDTNLIHSEGGHVLIEQGGKIKDWEKVASGSAIVRRYGKKAHDITDKKIWSNIAHDLAIGLYDLIAVLQPEIIVLGGSVGSYFDRFKEPLLEALKAYELPITPIPPIIPAARPEDAVLYGCYDLAKSIYG